MFTDEPDAAAVPAAGFWLMTVPAGTVALLVVVTLPTTNPEPCIALAAALWVWPTTLGTAFPARVTVIGTPTVPGPVHSAVPTLLVPQATVISPFVTPPGGMLPWVADTPKMVGVVPLLWPFAVATVICAPPLPE